MNKIRKLKDILKPEFRDATISVALDKTEFPYLRIFLDGDSDIVDILKENGEITLCVIGDSNDDFEKDTKEAKI